MTATGRRAAGRRTSAAVAGLKCDPNTSAVVVPCAASASTKRFGGAGGVGHVGHARFLGQRHVLQPVEQAWPEATQDAQAAEVDVRVYEARQHDAAAPVRDGRVRERRCRTARERRR